MKNVMSVILSLSLSLIYSCDGTNNSSRYESLIKISSTDGFKPYEGNPIIAVGPEGSFDAGALGSMNILLVSGVFHCFYETWGVRSEKEWDASEYESLTIGHATSIDGVNWTKDPQNPVLSPGGEGEWDETGVWDPYVIYEDGLFKMWYGGGGGRKPNFGWAYAVSKDGSNFEKKGLIGKNNPSSVEDVHVVHDKESGLYYMYYWHGHDEPNALRLVISPTETDFDFDKRVKVEIEGDNSFMKKFGHILKDKDGWHLFYSNCVQPYCPNSIVRYATSKDGINFTTVNKRIVEGHDADVLSVTDNLHMMLYSPQNGFDAKGCDIRLAVYNGNLSDIVDTQDKIGDDERLSLRGKTYTVEVGSEGPIVWEFREDGEVVFWPVGEKYDAFNALYIQDNENISIKGENLYLEGTYDGKILKLIDKSE